MSLEALFNLEPIDIVIRTQCKEWNVHTKKTMTVSQKTDKKNKKTKQIDNSAKQAQK